MSATPSASVRDQCCLQTDTGRKSWTSWQHTRRQQQQQQQQDHTDYYLFSLCLGAFKLQSPLPLHGSHYHPPKGPKKPNKPKNHSELSRCLALRPISAAAAAAAAALNQRIAPQLAPFKRLLQAIRRPNQQKRGLCVGRSRQGCFMTIINEEKITVMRGIRRPKIYN